jgi:hypothetical protein
MHVEWLGGPDDGKVMEVPDGIRHVSVAFLRSHLFPPPSDVKETPFMESLDLPIMSKGDKKYLVWRCR